MITELVAFIGALNSLTPVAIIGLLALVLFYQSKNNTVAVKHAEVLDTIKGNDLHTLPEVTENIRTMVETLQRMETSNAANFATVIARLNGGRK